MSDLFRSRTVGWIIGTVGLSLLALILFSIFSDDLFVRRTAGTSAFSNSAIGHSGFAELLRRLDIPVVVSRADSGVKAGEDAALILAEPFVTESDSLAAERLYTIYMNAVHIVIVLPKWWGMPDPRKPSWIEGMNWVPEANAQAVLDAIVVEGEIVRPDSSETLEWSSHFGLTPDLSRPQLIRSADLIPLVYCSQGILAGQLPVDYGTVLLISDPDLLSNHGLGRGRNALLAVQLLEGVRPQDGPVVIDETLHGFRVSRSIWRELFDFPLIVVVLQTILTAAALLWAAMTRFGRPLPLPPVREFGKRFLIENTAQLLHYGKHLPHAADRYFQLITEDVARRLHMPASVDFSRRLDWLQTISRNRGMGSDLLSLDRRTKDLTARTVNLEDRVVRNSRELHQWREEMIHGTRRTPKPL